MRKTALFLTLALLLAACGGGGDSTGPSRPNLDGAWSGSNAGITLSVTLNENRGDVFGDGNLTSINASIALTVSGTYSSPSVSLTMSAQGYQDLNFTGSMASPTSMTGTLNGSGFNGFAITLHKI